MSKGPRIKPTVERVIVQEALKDRDKPRRQLSMELKTIIEAMGEIVPEDETLERRISSARNHPRSPLDEPFSLASLAEYNIPPEAISTIMWVYKKRLRQAEQHFTIRQALWIARLYHIIDNPDLVGEWADVYAFREGVYWILGEPFFSRGLDFALIQYKYGGRMSGMTELGKRLSRYTPDRGPSPFPWGKEEEWEQRLAQKGFPLRDVDVDGMGDTLREEEAKIKEISKKLGLDEIEKMA